jgi:predicted small metal-binding protein
MMQADPEYHHVLRCPCGMTLTGDTEDEIVEVAFAHLREQHPDMADDYEREHILFMAIKLRK